MKIGSYVRINPTSEFYGEGWGNPTDMIGIVEEPHADDYPYTEALVYVRWSKHIDHFNTYYNKDLIQIYYNGK